MSNAEQIRLEASRNGVEWKKWGPYLSERQWGTVREDYSRNGHAWEYTPHDHARSKTYRWGEDGLAGISDDQQHLCFALALWNHQDPILKERLFGLTGPEGNHGEDVKEYYYYLDNTPTHAYMKYLYKYPQNPFPYTELVNVNNTRGKYETEYELIDTEIFNEDRYFDVLVEYAKADTEDICIQIRIVNRCLEKAPVCVLPSLWFRNTWRWEDSTDKRVPLIKAVDGHLEADQPDFGKYYLYAENALELLFCENETNTQQLYGQPIKTHSAKDGINDFIVHNRTDAVNPHQEGTKASLVYRLEIEGGQEVVIKLRLSSHPHPHPFLDFDSIFTLRKEDADDFYHKILNDSANEDLRSIQRQAYASMLWTKQFYYYHVREWLYGDPHHSPPLEERFQGRNSHWKHLHNADIISMPDKWEYPWYAVWDSAFHCIPLARLDIDFAKGQLLLFLQENYLHPNGQIPAYEWDFGDVNPPVHAWGVIKVYNMEQEMYGKKDKNFLKQAFHKLLLNFTWWVNRKDRNGNNIFEGGFLGLDNIGVFDRSRPLPTGGYIEQADGTSWMAMYCLNMMHIAEELAVDDPVYEDLVIKFFDHFLQIAASLDHIGSDNGYALWDDEDQFFYDVLHLPFGNPLRLKVRSIVGIIPLFAVEVMRQDHFERLPRFQAYLNQVLSTRPDLCNLVSRWYEPGKEDGRLFSLVRGRRMTRVLERVLDEAEFLSPYGMRGLSKYHKDHPYEYHYNGELFQVAYTPGESTTSMFGGNSNWRGPIWFPINYMLMDCLRKFESYYPHPFVIEYPKGSGEQLDLNQIIQLLSERLIDIFRLNEQDQRAVYHGCHPKMNEDPHFRDNILFYEYFHGDNGTGYGASHQTGWTGLIAEIIGQAY